MKHSVLLLNGGPINLSNVSEILKTVTQLSVAKMCRTFCKIHSAFAKTAYKTHANIKREE